MLSHIFFVVLHQSVVMAFAILGNLFLLFVILRGNHVAKRRISPVQLLLIHTCVADLLFALLSLGTEILTMISYPRFNGSNWMCKAMRYGQMLPHYASPFLLVAISADRYQAICRPLAHFRTSKYRRPTYLAMVAWLLSIVCSVPQLFVWQKGTRMNRITHQEMTECATIYGHGKNIFKNIYIIVFNTIAWLLPSILAGYFYYRVCKAVWMSGARVPKIVEEKENMKKCDVTQDYIDKLRKKSYGFRRQSSEFDRKRVQTVRLTMTIIVCNFFLWMPFCVVNVVLALWPTMLSPSFYLYVMTLGNLNSCVNPWIYILFNRSHVTKALCGSREKNAYTRSEVDVRSNYRSNSTAASSLKDNNNRMGHSLSVKVHRNISFQSSNGTSSPPDPATKPLVRNRSMNSNSLPRNEFSLRVTRLKTSSPAPDEHRLLAMNGQDDRSIASADM